MSGYEDEGVGLDSEIDEEGRNLTQQRIDEAGRSDLPVVPGPEEGEPAGE